MVRKWYEDSDSQLVTTRNVTKFVKKSKIFKAKSNKIVSKHIGRETILKIAKNKK